MPDRSIQEQLTRYLTDVHSIEVQALAQLERAPGIAGDDRLAAAFRDHLEETRDQERLVRARLDARGPIPRRSRTSPDGWGAWRWSHSPSSTRTRRAS